MYSQASKQAIGISLTTLLFLSATLCNRRCLAVELAPSPKAQHKLDVHDQEPTSNPLWKTHLLKLASNLHKLAVAHGARDQADQIQAFIDRESEFTPQVCRQFLKQAAKIANKLRNVNHFQHADNISLQIIHILELLDEDRSPGMAMMLTLKGVIAMDCEQYAEARLLFLEALAIYVERAEAQTDQAQSLWWFLGHVELKLGSLDEAEEIYHELLKQNSTQKHKRHPCLLASLSELYFLKNKPQRAYEYAQKANHVLLAPEEKVKYDALSYVASRVAIAAARKKEYKTANKIIDRALRDTRQKKGFLNITVANRHKDFANIFIMQGRIPEAREHLQQAIDIREALHGKNHLTVLELKDQLNKISPEAVAADRRQKSLDTLSEQLQGVTPARYAE